MARTFNNPFKNSKLKAFIVFLFLASVFWMLTKFSKQDVASVVTTISYVNIPQGFMLNENTPKDFIQNMTHRIDYYNPIEKISENWQFVERELPLEKITYEVDEGFILV